MKAIWCLWFKFEWFKFRNYLESTEILKGTGKKAKGDLYEFFSTFYHTKFNNDEPDDAETF